MNDDRPSPPRRDRIAFAGIVDDHRGAFQMFSGLVALVDDEFYVTTPEYVLQLERRHGAGSHAHRHRPGGVGVG